MAQGDKCNGSCEEVRLRISHLSAKIDEHSERQERVLKKIDRALFEPMAGLVTRMARLDTTMKIMLAIGSVFSIAAVGEVFVLLRIFMQQAGS